MNIIVICEKIVCVKSCYRHIIYVCVWEAIHLEFFYFFIYLGLEKIHGYIPT